MSMVNAPASAINTNQYWMISAMITSSIKERFQVKIENELTEQP